jgi:hypothetical protein
MEYGCCDFGRPMPEGLVGPVQMRVDDIGAGPLMTGALGILLAVNRARGQPLPGHRRLR